MSRDDKSDFDRDNSEWDDRNNNNRNRFSTNEESMMKSRDSERQVNISSSMKKSQRKTGKGTTTTPLGRRNMRWTSFARSKVSFGFKHLAPAYVPSMSADPRGIAICLDHVTGWSIPSNVLRDFRGKSNVKFEITAQLSLSMFHLNSSSFFGSTWMGPAIQLGSGDSEIPRVIDFPYSDVIYMTTRIIDPSCIGVIEIVVSKYDAANDLILSQCGCGWTMINLFEKPFPPDIAEGHENVSLTSCAIFSGSPRDLIINNDIRTLAKKLKEIPSCALFFRLFSHRRLLIASKLISENEAIGRYDEVAGLLERPVIPTGSRLQRHIPCLGDEELLDNPEGVIAIPATPLVLMPLTLKITNFQLDVPDRAALETRMCEVCEKSDKNNNNNNTKSKAQILSRTLKVGLHNGHTVVGGKWLTFPLVEDKSDRNILMLGRGSSNNNNNNITLTDYSPNELMALACVVEYELGLPVSRHNHFDSLAMVKSAKMASQTYREQQQQVSLLTLGAAVFVPSDGSTLSLKTRDSDNNDDDNDGLGVELLLSKDEACSIISPKPVMQQDQDNNSNNSNNIDVGRNSLDLMKSIRRSVDSIRSSGELSPNNKQSSLDFDEPSRAMLGFDLQAFLPSGQELRHRQQIEHLLRDDNNNIGQGFQEASSKEEEKQTRRSIGSFEISKVRRDNNSDREDEAALSVVTGDSDRSSLRLDAGYYTSHHRRDRGRGEEHSDNWSEEVTDKFLRVPKNKHSLLAKSLQTKLVSRNRDVDEFIRPENDNNNANNLNAMRVAAKTVIGATGNNNNAAYVRELSRGAKTRLNRYGFEGVVVDNNNNNSNLDIVNKHFKGIATNKELLSGHAIDLNLEAKDVLSVNEVSIQFAGFRSGVKVYDPSNNNNSRSSAVTLWNSSHHPKRIYFTFQFYTCASTRSEILKVLPSDSGQQQQSDNNNNILVRDEVYARDEVPLVMRFVIDCSRSSPTEGHEFTDYLASSTLFVDVWDADSLMIIGTCGIPLRPLLRQGNTLAKHTLECDLINSDMDGLSPSEGGVSTLTVTEGGPIAGTVVGAVHVIIANHGSEGSGSFACNVDKRRRQKTTDEDDDHMGGLNWRALGMSSAGYPKGNNNNSSRPSNTTRAKPLSESSPELAKALVDVRESGSGVNGNRSMRSLTSVRGDGGVSTLTYDEVAVLFKRFQGITKGSIQYSGPLMNLLDMPSWNVSVRKLVQCYNSFGNQEKFQMELLRYAGSDSRLSQEDIEECFRVMFETVGVHGKKEELLLLAQKLVSDDGNHNNNDKKRSIPAAQIAKFCSVEADRQEWTTVASRIRNASQNANLSGIDVEQMLSDKDSEGTSCISFSKFKEFLQELSKYGKISPKEMNLCCRHFSTRSANESDESRGPISLNTVMSFLGKEYSGNIQMRIRKLVCKEQLTAQQFLRKLNTLFSETKNRNVYSYDEVEAFLKSEGVFNELSHDQVRSVLVKLDNKEIGRVSAVQLLKYLGISFKASDLSMAADVTLDSTTQDINVEYLLRVLLEKVQNNGIAVDEAFRHFDTNGDGFISSGELLEGLDRLRIFDHIQNYKKEIPNLVAKFDTSGDGLVSLKEFFSFLGIKDYSPNIIQKMTKIFAIATQKGISFKDIFQELDEDHNGTLDKDELIAGLNKLGTFGEVSSDDAESVIAHFDKDKDKTVSISEFVDFFKSRVDLVLKERRKTQGEKIAKRFREVMLAAKSKGAMARDIFGHFDKDKGGTVTSDELAKGLRTLPNFKALSDQDIQDLVDVLDSDKNGTVSLSEFESFVEGGDASTTSLHALDSSVIGRVREIFKSAKERGLTFEKTFQLIDQDGNGQLTMKELETCLKKLPSFQNISKNEVIDLFDRIDTDQSGLITIDEFERYITGDELSKNKIGRNSESKNKEKINQPSNDYKDTFIRLMRRISEVDGSVSALLAFLDDDEDGFITLASLKNIFRREDMYQYIPEEAVDSLITPIANEEKKIEVIDLLRFIDGGKNINERNRESRNESEVMKVVKEYHFSKDPEIHSVERKLRSFGSILAKKGVDVESYFREYDHNNNGTVRRTEFIEILSKIGMYLLEQGKILDQCVSVDNDVRRQQVHMIQKGRGRSGTSYTENAPRMARRLLMNGSDYRSVGDFKDHLESMALVNWYRQSQKQSMLQRVLSHSLATQISIHPRFGKTLFFEQPITNPFGHEERFEIIINDPELRVVTSFTEWMHLRQHCRPCVGELGMDPIEVDMFDRDSHGRIQVCLLPHETLYIPFTFLTLIPHSPPSRSNRQQQVKRNPFIAEDKHKERTDREEEKEDKDRGVKEEDSNNNNSRSTDIRIVSGTHGHVVAVVKVTILPMPFVVDRTFRFFEAENSIMKKRIHIASHDNNNNRVMYPGEFTAASKYVHCVEGASAHDLSTGESQSRVVVEWGPSSSDFSGLGSLDLLVRFRCGPFPSIGMFYLLIYNDPHQSQLFELWQVIIQTRQRMDVHGCVGSAVNTDLVIRGDRYPRRAKAFCSFTPFDLISFRPENVFQLVPGAYNRLTAVIQPRLVGNRKVQINLVDHDTSELVSAWIVMVSSSAPAVMKTYEVDVPVGSAIHKKIVFKNPWDVARRFTLVSSDEKVMMPRNPTLDVAPNGSAYLRLWFSGMEEVGLGHNREVHLFLNDSQAGQNEECYLFKIREQVFNNDDNHPYHR